jgi:hypothetical protein
LGLRILGWITYGLCWSNGIYMLVTGLAADVDPGAAAITGFGVLGTTALTSFAIDSLVSRRQALALYSQGATAVNDSEGSDFRIGPALVPVRHVNGTTTLTLGLAAGF